MNEHRMAGIFHTFAWLSPIAAVLLAGRASTLVSSGTPSFCLFVLPAPLFLSSPFRLLLAIGFLEVPSWEFFLRLQKIGSPDQNAISLTLLRSHLASRQTRPSKAAVLCYFKHQFCLWKWSSSGVSQSMFVWSQNAILPVQPALQNPIPRNSPIWLTMHIQHPVSSRKSDGIYNARQRKDWQKAVLGIILLWFFRKIFYTDNNHVGTSLLRWIFALRWLKNVSGIWGCLPRILWQSWRLL